MASPHGSGACDTVGFASGKLRRFLGPPKTKSLFSLYVRTRPKKTTGELRDQARENGLFFPVGRKSAGSTLLIVINVRLITLKAVREKHYSEKKRNRKKFDFFYRLFSVKPKKTYTKDSCRTKKLRQGIWQRVCNN